MSGSGLYTTEEIYRLLPSVYRVRDAEQGGILRELVDVLTGQINVLAESLEQAYDDQFVETCADWVAPYIGDLVGYRTLHGVIPQIASPRADVANTIRYRRRKGTVSVLEQLARDVTGWPAHAVEFFELLVTTQFMNHIRPQAAATADLRSAARLELAGGFQAGAFDGFAHTGEMRRIGSRSGRYNIPNVGIFLWRVQALRLGGSPLVDADGSGLRFRFDPLGTDKPLFATPRTETEITHLAEPLDVPLPLLRRFLEANLAALYGAGGSLLLETETAGGLDDVAVTDIRVCDLSDDPSLPGTLGARAAAGRHVGRGRPGTRPRRVRGAAGGRRDDGSRPSTTARRSPSAAAATTAPPRSSSCDTVVSVCGRRPARAGARRSRRRRRGTDPRQPPLCRAGRRSPPRRPRRPRTTARSSSSP